MCLGKSGFSTASGLGTRLLKTNYLLAGVNLTLAVKDFSSKLVHVVSYADVGGMKSAGDGFVTAVIKSK